MSISDLFLQIILALAGLALGIVSALLPKTEQRRMLNIVAAILLISGVAWAGYELNRKVDALFPPLPPQPVNVYNRIDFEKTIDGWNLVICGDDPCRGADSPWFEANGKLSQVQPGFTGKSSLQIVADFRPDKGQVYSVQYCPDATALADALSAKVFVPEAAVSGSSLSIVMLAKPEGIESPLPWPNSTLNITKSGWQHLFLDLKHDLDIGGKPFSERAVTCVHVDFLLSKSGLQQVKSVPFLLDDVEFYKPLP